MNVNQVYIIIGVAAITALVSTLVSYLIEFESPAAVIGASAGATIAVTAVMINNNRKKKN